MPTLSLTVLVLQTLGHRLLLSWWVLLLLFIVKAVPTLSLTNPRTSSATLLVGLEDSLFKWGDGVAQLVEHQI